MENCRLTLDAIDWRYPLVIYQFANWIMAIEIVSYPMNSMVIFHSKLLNYQRVAIFQGYFKIWKKFRAKFQGISSMCHDSGS
jgi:hypothetical protein